MLLIRHATTSKIFINNKTYKSKMKKGIHPDNYRPVVFKDVQRLYVP